MPFVIPTFNGGTTKYNVNLNGQVFFFRTYWNEFALMWFLDITDVNDENVAMGLALVPDVNILGYSPQLSQDIGELRISDPGGDGNATETSLGDTATLYYFLPGEFETLFPDFNKEEVRTQQFVFDDLFTVVQVTLP